MENKTRFKDCKHKNDWMLEALLHIESTAIKSGFASRSTDIHIGSDTVSAPEWLNFMSHGVIHTLEDS